MKIIAWFVFLVVAWLAVGPAQLQGKQLRKPKPIPNSLFAQKLNSRVERFSTSGRTLLASILDLTYKFQLPTGLEYIDSEAATRPIDFDYHNESVQQVLLAMIAEFPEYRVRFSDGLVDLYAPKARKSASNLLNTAIANFSVKEMDTHRADMELVCALARQLVPPGGCGGSIAVGQWGSLRITVQLRHAKVFEILNAIVAQNGKAIWMVMAPPERLSTPQFGGLWHIYPLEAPFKTAVLDRLNSIYQRRMP